MSQSHLAVAILSLIAYASLPACIALAYTRIPLLFGLFFFAYFASSFAVLVMVAKEWKRKKSLLLYAFPVLGLLAWTGYKIYLFAFGDIPD